MTDFEYGRLLACKGDRDRAHFHLELVISGKPLEVNAANRKGKYSIDRKSTRLNSSHSGESRMPSSA